MIEKLTEAELLALEQCGGGCDVLGYGMARHLRAVERKRPELIDICPAMGEYGVKDKHPYFGAISTAKGKREVEAWRNRSKKGKAGSSTLDIETVISRDGTRVLALKTAKGRVYAIVFAKGMSEPEVGESLKRNPPSARDWRPFDESTRTFL